MGDKSLELNRAGFGAEPKPPQERRVWFYYTFAYWDLSSMKNCNCHLANFLNKF